VGALLLFNAGLEVLSGAERHLLPMEKKSIGCQEIRAKGSQGQGSGIEKSSHQTVTAFV